MIRYRQIYEHDWNDCNWKREYEMCCDCGLVHKVAYRIKNGRVQQKVSRDNKRTYAARRRAGIKIVRTK